MIGENSVAAATAVVGYNLANNTVWQSARMPRLLTGFALKGSAAAGDTKVDVLVDTTKVAEKFNTGTGFPNNDDLVPMNVVIPPNAMLNIYVTDAPATNPINVLVRLVELPMGAPAFRGRR